MTNDFQLNQPSPTLIIPEAFKVQSSECLLASTAQRLKKKPKNNKTGVEKKVSSYKENQGKTNSGLVKSNASASKRNLHFKSKNSKTKIGVEVARPNISANSSEAQSATASGSNKSKIDRLIVRGSGNPGQRKNEETIVPRSTRRELHTKRSLDEASTSGGGSKRRTSLHSVPGDFSAGGSQDFGLSGRIGRHRSHEMTPSSGIGGRMRKYSGYELSITSKKSSTDGVKSQTSQSLSTSSKSKKAKAKVSKNSLGSCSKVHKERKVSHSKVNKENAVNSPRSSDKDLGIESVKGESLTNESIATSQLSVSAGEDNESPMSTILSENQKLEQDNAMGVSVLHKDRRDDEKVEISSHRGSLLSFNGRKENSKELSVDCMAEMSTIGAEDVGSESATIVESSCCTCTLDSIEKVDAVDSVCNDEFKHEDSLTANTLPAAEALDSQNALLSSTQSFSIHAEVRVPDSQSNLCPAEGIEEVNHVPDSQSNLCTAEGIEEVNHVPDSQSNLCPAEVIEEAKHVPDSQSNLCPVEGIEEINHVPDSQYNLCPAEVIDEVKHVPDSQSNLCPAEGIEEVNYIPESQSNLCPAEVIEEVNHVPDIQSNSCPAEVMEEVNHVPDSQSNLWPVEGIEEVIYVPDSQSNLCPIEEVNYVPHSQSNLCPVEGIEEVIHVPDGQSNLCPVEEVNHVPDSQSNLCPVEGIEEVIHVPDGQSNLCPARLVDEVNHVPDSQSNPCPAEKIEEEYDASTLHPNSGNVGFLLESSDISDKFSDLSDSGNKLNCEIVRVVEQECSVSTAIDAATYTLSSEGDLVTADEPKFYCPVSLESCAPVDDLRQCKNKSAEDHHEWATTIEPDMLTENAHKAKVADRAECHQLPSEAVSGEPSEKQDNDQENDLICNGSHRASPGPKICQVVAFQEMSPSREKGSEIVKGKAIFTSKLSEASSKGLSGEVLRNDDEFLLESYGEDFQAGPQDVEQESTLGQDEDSVLEEFHQKYCKEDHQSLLRMSEEDGSLLRESDHVTNESSEASISFSMGRLPSFERDFIGILNLAFCQAESPVQNSSVDSSAADSGKKLEKNVRQCLKLWRRQVFRSKWPVAEVCSSTSAPCSPNNVAAVKKCAFNEDGNHRSTFLSNAEIFKGSAQSSVNPDSCDRLANLSSNVDTGVLYKTGYPDGSCSVVENPMSWVGHQFLPVESQNTEAALFSGNDRLSLCNKRNWMNRTEGDLRDPHQAVGSEDDVEGIETETVQAGLSGGEVGNSFLLESLAVEDHLNVIKTVDEQNSSYFTKDTWQATENKIASDKNALPSSSSSEENIVCLITSDKPLKRRVSISYNNPQEGAGRTLGSSSELQLKLFLADNACHDLAIAQQPNGSAHVETHIFKRTGVPAPPGGECRPERPRDASSDWRDLFETFNNSVVARQHEQFVHVVDLVFWVCLAVVVIVFELA
ncbi:aggrecan core protein [Plakobranchus ocellatus]|uniref:Aggrecan core protein n=1 Tax=Plakobranchus ocellatus TaxID=259542 RepID=A0AAV4BB39_9GAST|nr:aggrecan core protein [Plakobranchus ocellatus]